MDVNHRGQKNMSWKSQKTQDNQTFWGDGKKSDTWELWGEDMEQRGSAGENEGAERNREIPHENPTRVSL